MTIVKGCLVTWGVLSLCRSLTLTDLNLACSGSDPWTGSVLTNEGFHLSPFLSRIMEEGVVPVVDTGNRCDLAKEHCTKCSRNNTVDISGIVYFC